jgi:hypothetical protein
MQMQDADDVRYIDADADADVDVDADALYITRSTPYVECSICAYSIKALTIGYSNLSVGPIFLLTEFNQNVSIIGILFAAGASCGTISAVSATLTKPGKWFFNKYLPVCACRICQPCVCACVLASCAIAASYRYALQTHHHSPLAGVPFRRRRLLTSTCLCSALAARSSSPPRPFWRCT